MIVAIYVHALTDAPVMPWEEDEGRRIESIEIEGFFVVGERRATVPPVSEAELQRQHSLVLRISDAVAAVIPARFGSLLEESEQASVLRHRHELIRTTLDYVRDNVQMTLRMAGGGTASAGAVAPTSGREYMQRRREELVPPVPSHAENLLRELRAFILDERRKPAERGIVAVYHLIGRRDVKEYRATVTDVGTPGIAVSGPFAPFAFAPDLFG